MARADADSFIDFVEGANTSPATLLVLNRTDPVPLLSLLERAFQRQPVHVVEREVPGPVENHVALVDDSGVVATSQLQDVADSFLLINADRFRTGANALETEAVPAVLRQLDDIEFDLRGYPESAKEKLLLILMSRYVEASALSADAGELHVGFQRLSRLDDERGTRQVYELLGESGVDTHVYGVGGDATEIPAGVRAHTEDSETYRRSWFLVHEAADDETEATALVAWETGENVWRGTWTFDDETAAAVGEFVRTTL